MPPSLCCPPSVFWGSWGVILPCTHMLPLEPDMFFFSRFGSSTGYYNFYQKQEAMWCLNVESLEPDGLGLNPCSAMILTNLAILNKSFNYFVLIPVIVYWLQTTLPKLSVLNDLKKNHLSWFCETTGSVSWVLLSEASCAGVLTWWPVLSHWRLGGAIRASKMAHPCSW